ncbi:hypothetical protein CHLRE_11g467740v5 [Chlamydomonas reinhardtii]|uniref:Methyltransferase domain-containing protein n=1 Tax=Chlamydomonas reinhardtii TaxID=3055 RepID=A8JBY3_CHLRE|nr:uncharacterized protein CHLRE_11g467740v5 [Chlamydomonas reinhardtii]PNW76619.1 hypothetical protein CHLRE_11g467740v5 [Chlamydomonas reinhardtii]|eukprot:XP_001699513.1 predicted protein [Chlamydomonas reinhardtii]
MLQRLRLSRLAGRVAASHCIPGLVASAHGGRQRPAVYASTVPARSGLKSERRGPASRRARYVPTSAVAASEAPEASNEPSTSAPSTIYSRPDLYEVAFSYRDFKAEVKFLQEVYKQHNKHQLSSVLELGCGPARHLAGLARGGVAKVVGLDLSPDMLGHARKSLSKQGGKAAEVVELVQGDMSDFDLPHKSFDMVMCLLGTFSHLLDTDQAISSFRSAAAHLRPGGILLLEMAHPGDLFDGTLIIGESGKEVWELPQENGDKVFVEWGAEFDNFDPVTQIIFRTVTINVLRGDDVVDSVEEVVPYRQYTVRELELLAKLAGLEQIALYGEMRMGVDLEHEDAYRMLALYRKP